MTRKAVNPQVVAKSFVAELKQFPYFEIQSVQKGKVVFTAPALNSQLDRVEIEDLDTDVAHYKFFLKNGLSGWGWNEFRKPPKFLNDLGFNRIFLTRFPDPTTEPEKFRETALNVITGSFVEAIQVAGFVFDPISQRVLKFDQWLALQPKPQPSKMNPRVLKYPEGGFFLFFMHPRRADHIWTGTRWYSNFGFAKQKDPEIFSSEQAALEEAEKKAVPALLENGWEEYVSGWEI